MLPVSEARTRLLASKPLTIAQLKSMNGEPVWVKIIDHSNFADPKDDFDGWGLCRKSWVRIWDATRADLISVTYDFNEYGKTWLAYSYINLLKKG